MLTLRAPRRSGFSLIELMVALVIFGLGIMAVTPTIVDWMRNMAIRNAGEALKGGVEKARQAALKRNASMTFWLVKDDAKTLTDGCALSDAGPSWVVSKADPSGACSVAASETNAPRIVEKWSAAQGAEGVVLATQDEAGVAVSSVTFNSLGQITQAGQLARIDMRHEAGGDTRPLRLLIDRGGSIRLCDPAVPAADTRSC